jgi:cytochrome c553
VKSKYKLILMLFYLPAVIQAGALEERLDSYQSEGAGPFSAEQGRVAWQREVMQEKSGKLRSCTDCHGTDLSRNGRHVKTGKTIEPMVPSVNGQRLSDGKKIEKWFKRNCKWTWGRVCTDQEKGDILRYLQQQ